MINDVMHDSGPTASDLLGRKFTILAWIVLAVAMVHPPHDTGVALCWINATTGVPCPGCGMTRSVSAAMRGMFEQSVLYHPFGALLLAACVLVAAMSLLPRHCRVAIAHRLQEWMRLLRVIKWAIMTSFVAFGAARAALAIAAHLSNTHA